MPQNISVLVVVQESGQQNLLGRLEGLGATVQAASDCLTAMAVVKTERPDLVLLANCQGQFDAPETARVLKSLRTDRYLPVVAIVAKGLDLESRRPLLEAGVDDFLPADFDDEILDCRLHAVLRLKSAYDQLREARSELEKTLARESALMRQLREDNRNLKVRSITDGLTALYNYRYLMEWLKTEFKIARRYGHPLSMIIVDIDHFKGINDEYGHPFGDHALKEVAVLLKKCARESDLVARYAGDEFALVCPRTGLQEVESLARRILAAVRRHEFICKEARVPLTLSLGAATYPEDPEVVSPELLVFLADQALYQTKRRGRNGATAWHAIDAETRAAIRRELRGPDHPLLADDPRSRLELAAAARLAGTPAEPNSLRLARSELPSEP
jgi:diguanylate cyclase (GGDEF)-like protein